MIFSVFQKKWVLGYSWSNKTWWKPRFPMDKRPLVKGLIANFVIFLDISEFLRFWWFFPFFKKNWVLGYSWTPLLWHRWYYPHRSRDALSPVCGTFHKQPIVQCTDYVNYASQQEAGTLEGWDGLLQEEDICILEQEKSNRVKSTS